MDGDGATLFNPSTFQNENDEDQEDEEEQRQIEQQVTISLIFNEQYFYSKEFYATFLHTYILDRRTTS